MFDAVKNFAREYKDLERLIAAENKPSRQLIFYSERDIYFRYYEDFIDYVLSNSDLSISYITSDPNDPVFKLGNQRIKTFYIKNLLMATFSQLDGGVLVMTAPDLNQTGIKRAPAPVHHLYVFHGISSIHRGYRPGAFDHYDSILCLADYQMRELRKTEEVYNLKAKNLILTGYPLVERINREYQLYRNTHANSEPPLILIAPTWGPSSLMEVCGRKLIETLATTPYKVIVRPHPEFIKRRPDQMRSIEQAVSKTNNISIQPKLDSLAILQQADLLITDHSSIVFEYVLGTERPALLIDTPNGRLDNPHWEELGLEAVELTHRKRLGRCLSSDRLTELASAIGELLSSQQQFQASLPGLRDELLANWQSSTRVGGEAMINLCREMSQQNANK